MIYDITGGDGLDILRHFTSAGDDMPAIIATRTRCRACLPCYPPSAVSGSAAPLTPAHAGHEETQLTSDSRASFILTYRRQRVESKNIFIFILFYQAQHFY